MMRLIFIVFTLVFFKDCPPKNATANANAAPTAAIVAPTPQKSIAQVSACAKERVTNAPADLNIPSELCLDDKKPIDATEDKTVSDKLVGNVLSSDDDIAFDKLPPEVREVIKLLTGERYASAKFHLDVTLGPDAARGNRSVKSYSYTPKLFDAKLNAETLATETFQFRRQNKLLKLESAELDAAQ